MKTAGFILCGVVAVALVASAFIMPATWYGDNRTLANVVPNDVFLFVSDKSNDKRDFIDQYWAEVFETLLESGVGDDILDMFSSGLGMETNALSAETTRIKDKIVELAAGVDWVGLEGEESVFVERFHPPKRLVKRKPFTLSPNLAWLSRSTPESAARNFEGLVGLLQGLVDEGNAAIGSEFLSVERSTRQGSAVAQLQFKVPVPEDVVPTFYVAQRDEILVIAMQRFLFGDILDFLDGTSKKKALADDARFKEALAQLPPAQDLLTFFDMQSMLKPLHSFGYRLIDMVNAPGDVRNEKVSNPEVTALNNEAIAVSGGGDQDKALALLTKAHELDPDYTLVLYNLACVNAMSGKSDAALDWLMMAVEAGFYAPQHMAMDTDLDSLRNDARFKAVMARATELALQATAKDVVLNCAHDGEIFRLRMQVREAREKGDFENCLKIIEQAYTIAPKDSMVLYILACYHMLLGHEQEAFDFLAESVEAGFYCHEHMAVDHDWEGHRHKAPFQASLARAKELAGEVAAKKRKETVTMVKGIVDRVAHSVGFLDYALTVESTEGYDTFTESIAVLMPDAEERPIYALFGDRAPFEEFDSYLPKETASFTITGGINMDALYGFFEDTVRMIGPKGEEVLGRWDEIQKMIGVNVRKEVIGWIDGDSIDITLEDGNTVSMMKVTNEEAARTMVAGVIEMGTTKLAEVIRANRAMAGLAMLGLRTAPCKHEALEGFQNLYFSMAPKPLVWGVADGYIIFGSSADSVALCLATARGEHPNVRENPRVMAETIVPKGSFVGLSLTDYRNLNEEIAGALGMGTMMAGMMGTFIPDPEAGPILAKIAGILGKLVPVANSIDFYKSASSLTTFDGKKWHTRSVTHYFSPEERAGEEMH